MTTESPKHVALVGMGPDWWLSKETNAEQVWGINSLNLLRQVDILFNMHDIEALAANPDITDAERETYIKSLEKAQKDGTPVVGCYTWDRFSCIQPYPIDLIVEGFGIDYFTCTASYMIAYAVAIGVRRMDLFGITGKEDYEHQGPCLHYWLGQAMGRGIDVRSLGRGSNLLRTQPGLSAPTTRQHRYGYDKYPVGVENFFEELLSEEGVE